MRTALACAVRDAKRPFGLSRASLKVVSGGNNVKCVVVSHGAMGPSANVFCTVNFNQQYRLAPESCTQPSM